MVCPLGRACLHSAARFKNAVASMVTVLDTVSSFRVARSCGSRPPGSYSMYTSSEGHENGGDRYSRVRSCRSLSAARIKNLFHEIRGHFVCRAENPVRPEAAARRESNAEYAAIRIRHWKTVLSQRSSNEIRPIGCCCGHRTNPAVLRSVWIEPAVLPAAGGSVCRTYYDAD